MSLYDLHQSPDRLYRYADADMYVPTVFWNTYNNNPSELKTREPAIAKSAKYSYLYALGVIEGRWPPGEHTIVKVHNTAIGMQRM